MCWAGERRMGEQTHYNLYWFLYVTWLLTIQLSYICSVQHHYLLDLFTSPAGKTFLQLSCQYCSDWSVEVLPSSAWKCPIATWEKIEHLYSPSFLTMELLPFSLHCCVTVCLCVFHRELGGETMLRETFRGALSAQWEGYCLSDRGLRHHAAGMWHAGGGQNQQMHDMCLLPLDKSRGNNLQRNWSTHELFGWTFLFKKSQTV